MSLSFGDAHQKYPSHDPAVTGKTASSFILGIPVDSTIQTIVQHVCHRYNNYFVVIFATTRLPALSQTQTSIAASRRKPAALHPILHHRIFIVFGLYVSPEPFWTQTTRSKTDPKMLPTLFHSHSQAQAQCLRG
jgi:hypothetical protein